MPADFYNDTVTVYRDAVAVDTVDDAGVPTVTPDPAPRDLPAHIEWGSPSRGDAGAVTTATSMVFSGDEDIDVTDRIEFDGVPYRVLAVTKPRRLSGDVWHTRVRCVKATR